MSNEFVDVLNQETGERGRIRRNLFESPIFNRGILVEVDPTQKPYTKGFFKSRVEGNSPEVQDEPAAKQELSFAESAPKTEKTASKKKEN